MLVFEVTPYGVAWQVSRNGRLVCFFNTEDEAVDAAKRFIEANRSMSKAAKLKLYEAPSLTEHQH